jgi:protein-tyrosine phosphatase
LNRNLTVEGSCNVRDLGGYPTDDGHITRWKVFVRAGDMGNVSVEGCLLLTDYGIKTIIDLRDEWEVDSFPNVLAQAEAIQYVNLPLIGNRLSQDESWKSESATYDYLHELYVYYLDHCQPQIAAIIGAVAKSTSGTIFHCYAGKDRTGLIAALVLGAVGVPSEMIAEDYAQTRQHISPLVERLRVNAAEHGRNMQHFERDMASLPETMIETLAYLDSRYGGVQSYLTTCGVSAAQIKLLSEKFVE